jgi:hypothetical protein
MKTNPDATEPRIPAGNWVILAVFVAGLVTALWWAIPKTWEPWTKSDIVVVVAIAIFMLGLYLGEKSSRAK